MGKVRSVGLALLLAAAPAAHAAEGDAFLCKVKADGPFEDAIPDMVAFRVGASEGGTLVYDPFIATYYKEPIEASLLADTDIKVKIRWIIKFVPEGSIASARLQYELTYFKGQDRATLRAKLPYGESHEPSFDATCAREKWD